MMFGENILPRIFKTVAEGYDSRFWAVKEDFSKFDVRIHQTVKDMALNIVEQNIIFDEWKGKKKSPSATRRWYRLWEFVREYQQFTPVMTPDGRIWKQKGKVSSGSDLTSIIDSISSALYTLTACYYFDHPTRLLRVLGDDVYVVVERKPDMNAWAEFYEWAFRAVLSVDKTMLFKGTAPVKQFLGYEFRNGFLYLPEKDLFMRALYPETDIDEVHKSVSRLIAFMFLGGAGNENFTNFVQYYTSGYPIDYKRPVDFDREMMKRIKHTGYPIVIKPVGEYDLHDFVWGAISYKDSNKH